MPKPTLPRREPVATALLPIPRTLVYKRTHNKGCGDDGRCNGGDPCAAGCFGCCDCMGRDRCWEFDAVIGIGGIGREARRNGLAGKVNWIGIGRQDTPAPTGWDGPLLTFDQYLNFDISGPDLYSIAPDLADLMYSVNRRAVMNFSPAVQAQIRIVLDLARAAGPSPCRGQRPQRRHGCCCRH